MKNNIQKILEQIKHTSVADFQGLHDFSALSPQQRLTWLSGMQKFLVLARRENVSKGDAAELNDQTIPHSISSS